MLRIGLLGAGMIGNTHIDAVDLCLPSFMHEEFAVKIARAKKHLLIEDPEIVSEQSVMQALASVLAAKESLTKGIIII